MNLNISSISVVRLAYGMDHVYINLSDIPEAAYPHTGPLSMKFEASRGCGEEFAKKHFPGIPVTVVEI